MCPTQAENFALSIIFSSDARGCFTTGSVRMGGRTTGVHRLERRVRPMETASVGTAALGAARKSRKRARNAPTVAGARAKTALKPLEPQAKSICVLEWIACQDVLCLACVDANERLFVAENALLYIGALKDTE